MEIKELQKIIEGALLAAGRPLTFDDILSLFGLEDSYRPARDELHEAMKNISLDCEDRGFELKQVASGYRFQVRQELSQWVGRLWDEKPQKYSRALLETLAIIAYRQPVTRGEIEEIRGVSVNSNIVKTLLEREWIRVVGHRDVPGRPAILATTRKFLDYFNLRRLDDLPPLSEIKDLVDMAPELGLEEELKASVESSSEEALSQALDPDFDRKTVSDTDQVTATDTNPELFPDPVLADTDNDLKKSAAEGTHESEIGSLQTDIQDNSSDEVIDR